MSEGNEHLAHEINREIEDMKYQNCERKYLARPTAEVVAEMMREFASDSDEMSLLGKFSEWIFFENGRRFTFWRE